MPNNKSAEKRNRQNETRRMHNKCVRSEVRTSIKSFESAVKDKNVETAELRFRTMVKLLDTATRKGIFPVNTTSRKKSRMNKLLNSLKG